MMMTDNFGSNRGGQGMRQSSFIKKNLIKFEKSLPTTKCLSILVINLSERWILGINPGIELYILTNNPLASTDSTFAVTFSPGTASCNEEVK